MYFPSLVWPSHGGRPGLELCFQQQRLKTDGVKSQNSVWRDSFLLYFILFPLMSNCEAFQGLPVFSVILSSLFFSIHLNALPLFFPLVASVFKPSLPPSFLLFVLFQLLFLKTHFHSPPVCFTLQASRLHIPVQLSIFNSFAVPLLYSPCISLQLIFAATPALKILPFSLLLYSSSHTPSILS